MKIPKFSFDCTKETPYTDDAVIDAVRDAGFIGTEADVTIHHDFIGDICEHCGQRRMTELLSFDRRRLFRR